MLKDLSQDELYLYIKKQIKERMDINNPNFFQRVTNGEIEYIGRDGNTYTRYGVFDVSPLELTDEQKENILENLAELQSRWLYGVAAVTRQYNGEEAFSDDRIMEEIDRICDTSFTRFGIEENKRANQMPQGANIRYNIDENGQPLKGHYGLEDSSDPQKSMDIICLTIGEGRLEEALQILASKNFLENEDNLMLISILVHENCHSMQAIKDEDEWKALITRQYNLNIDIKKEDGSRRWNQWGYIESGTEFMKTLVMEAAFKEDYSVETKFKFISLNSAGDEVSTAVSIPMQFYGYDTLNPYAILFNIDRTSFINDYVNGARDCENYFFSQFINEEEGKKGNWLSNGMADSIVSYNYDNPTSDYWIQDGKRHDSGRIMFEYQKMADIIIDAYKINFKKNCDINLDETLDKYLRDTIYMSEYFPQIISKDENGEYKEYKKGETIVTLNLLGNEIEVPTRPMDNSIARIDEVIYGKHIKTLSENLGVSRDVDTSSVLDILREELRENPSKQFCIEDFSKAIEKSLEKEKNSIEL